MLTTYIPGQVATVKATANIRVAPALTAPVIRTAAAAETWIVTGWATGEVDPDGGSNQWLVRWNDGWEYTAKSNVSAGPAVPPVPSKSYPVTVGGKPAGTVTLP